MAVDRKGGAVWAWPLYAKRLLSPAEQTLYFKLCKIFPEYVVFPQVSLSGILRVKKGYKKFA